MIVNKIYAVKGEEKIEITPENKDTLIGYKIVTEEVELTTEEEYNYRVEQINKEFKKDIEVFTSKYSIEEMQTWDLKVREAEKVLAGETSSVLDSLEIPGRTTRQLAEMILENSQAYFTVYTEAEKKKTLSIIKAKEELKLI